MAKPQNFFEYGNDISPIRNLSYRQARLVPNNLQSSLNQINVKSVTALYEFLTSNPKYENFFFSSSGLYEDEMARLKENITTALETEGVIDDRCGNKSDPCHVISKKA